MFFFQENNTTTKRELPVTYQREIDIKGIGKTYGYLNEHFSEMHVMTDIFFSISNFADSFKTREKTSSGSVKSPSKPTSTTPRYTQLILLIIRKNLNNKLLLKILLVRWREY